MNVQAVAVDGNVVSLTATFLKAIKVEEMFGEVQFQCGFFSEVVFFFSP